MGRYMLADMRRFTRQKSRFIYVTFILALIVLMGFLSKKFKWGDSVYNLVMSYAIAAFPIVIGPTIFIALFSDDFRYKSIQQVIGRGLSRTKYVIAKFIECILINVFYMILIFGAYFLATKAFGIVIDKEEMTMITTSCLQGVIMTVGYISIAMILVFAWQNITLGLWIFFALAAGIVSTAVTLIFTFDFLPKAMQKLSNYLFSSMVNGFITALIEGKFDIMIIPAVLIYLVLPVIISCALFKTVELDF